MAHPRFSLVKNDSTAHLGFEQKLRLAADKWKNNGDAVEPCGARKPARGCPQGVHPFGVPPKLARRESANIIPESIPQVVSEAKDNMAGFDFVCLRYATAVLANGSMSSNQSGDCPARSANLKPKAKSQSLPRQRDIRRALIEADLVDTALRNSAFPQREATSQVLSKAKNNMVALPGQLSYSTQIPVCLWFLAKNKNVGALTHNLN